MLSEWCLQDRGWVGTNLGLGRAQKQEVQSWGEEIGGESPLIML